jgi:cellulose synthase (UDP-forming)
LSLTDAPFIAVFDADFVPKKNFLRKTIGFFEDESIGIVQTPQVFYNKDSFQNSLRMQNVITDDQRFFFRHVMPCRDAWGVAFYVGSSAVLRRKAIEAIGGIVTDMATEDQATSVAMLAKGYRTRYLNEPLSSGLAPESSFAMVEQRKRWCRGGIQLAFRRFGPFGPDLKSLKARLFFVPTYWVLGYMNAAFFLLEATGCWYLGFTPFVAVDPMEILIGSIATFILYSTFLIWVGRGTWMPIVSPAFHLFMAFAVVPTALTSIIKPWGKPLLAFAQVTPKGESAYVTRVNDAALWPLLVAISILGFGVISAVFFPLSLRLNPGENLVLAIWTALMFTQMFFALLACFEPPYRRKEERFIRDEPVEVVTHGVSVSGVLADISLSGARILGNFASDVQALCYAGITIPIQSYKVGTNDLRIQFGELKTYERRVLIEHLFALTPVKDDEGASPFSAIVATLTRLLMWS